MRFFVLALGVSVSGCSLLVDLSPLGGAVDASGQETSTDATADVVGGDASPNDASAEADAKYAFLDDFNRADAGDVGNGWLVKNPAFTVAGDQAFRVKQSSFDYRDLMVYRPASESVRDVETSMEVTPGVAGGYPQIHVRIQSATVAIANVLDDYLMFPQAGTTTAMTLARNRLTNNYFTLTTFPLSSPLDTSHAFRFTLRATGANPVILFGSVERYDAPNWTMLGSSSAQDGDTTNAITTDGVVGFSAGSNDATGQYAYDNYKATGL